MSNEFVMVPRELAARIARAGCWPNDAEELRALLGQSVEQHQDEPVALPARKAITAHGLTALDSEAEGWNACVDEVSKLGPLYTHPALAEQQEPVPISDDMSRLMDAYRLGEFTAEGGSETIEALAVASFDAVADQGHDADSYMAGFCASLYWQAAPFIEMALKPKIQADPGEVERLRNCLRTEIEAGDSWKKEAQDLRDQLAELDALLSVINRKATEYACKSIPTGHECRFGDEIAAISASAEPSAPKCEACKGIGVIGWRRGQTAESYEEGESTCEDCDGTGQSAPVERDERGDGPTCAICDDIGDQCEQCRIDEMYPPLRAALERKP